ncbi:BatD family protein [Methanosarcina hadiensis]|uniref:BatD family protein n=1 Tax=Methanosarcina hadiensis TaxID=3078083 RepID=UPI0039778B27
MKVKGVDVTILFAFSILLITGSTACAESIVYEGDIEEGQAYQLNNYVIDFTDIFPEANTVSYYVYEEEEEITNGLMDVNESAEFDFEEEGKVQMRVKSVHSGSPPSATIEITMSNYSTEDLFVNKVIEEGRSGATYSGDPDLVITKTVDKSEIKVGENITVTVKARNAGNDTANNVSFTDPKQEHFVLEETIFETSSEIPEINYGESVPETLVYMYKLKATDAGTFELKAVNASYINSAGKVYQSSSNIPLINVSEGNKQVAKVEATMSISVSSLERNQETTSIIVLKNTGNAPAEAVRFDIFIPEGLEYAGGEGIENVGGNPRIYLETLQTNNDKEFTYNLKGKEVGTYNISSRLSYEYSDGINQEKIKEKNESAGFTVSVKEGKFDFILKNPLYIIIPLIILAAIGFHLYRRHREYRY